MRFNSVKRGNFSSLAKSVNRTMDQVFNSSRETAMDNTKIANEAIKGRSMERRAAMKAEAEVSRAGLAAYSKVKMTKNDIETDKKIRDIKRPAKRMAGIVGGLGAIAGGFVAKKNAAEDKAERLALRAEQQAIFDKQTEMQQGVIKQQQALIASLKTPPKDSPSGTAEDTSVQGTGSTDTTKTTPPSSSGDTPDPSSSEDTSAPAVSGVKPTSQAGFRGDVYNYLTQHHKLSKNKALGLMANIDRESSFRINPEGGDGGNSFGMFQWNNTYGRSDIMKKNVKDWQTNWKGQIDHALSGNQLPEYNKVTTDFKNTTFGSSQEAADYWMKHWERPAHQERDSKKHTQFLSGYNF